MKVKNAPWTKNGCVVECRQSKYLTIAQHLWLSWLTAIEARGCLNLPLDGRNFPPLDSTIEEMLTCSSHVSSSLFQVSSGLITATMTEAALGKPLYSTWIFSFSASADNLTANSLKNWKQKKVQSLIAFIHKFLVEVAGRNDEIPQATPSGIACWLFSLQYCVLFEVVSARWIAWFEPRKFNPLSTWQSAPADGDSLPSLRGDTR